MLVLIVDDDPMMLRFFQDLFKRENEHTLITASSGEQAMEMLKIAQPDIIMLDFLLPGIDGLELCREIKSNRLLTNKIILLSAVHDSEKIKLAYELGAIDYIRKPFETYEFLAKLNIYSQLNFGVQKIPEKILKIGQFINEIAYITATHNNCSFFTFNNVKPKKVERVALRELTEFFDNLLQINKSMMVNKNYVETFIQTKNKKQLIFIHQFKRAIQFNISPIYL